MSGTETSARLALPFLTPGQAQKETTHNEALAMIDLAVQASVVGVGTNVPPTAPTVGDGWIVGAAPTGAWTGRAQALAGWTTGGWRFVTATPGMAVWSLADGAVARYVGGGWSIGILAGARVTIGGEQVVGARRPAIADPAGGTVTDAAARTAIAAILGALRGHGLIVS